MTWLLRGCDNLLNRASYSSVYYKHLEVRDWSLNMGGAQNGRGEHVKFYPYEKGGGKSFNHADGGGGHKQF